MKIGHLLLLLILGTLSICFRIQQQQSLTYNRYVPPYAKSYYEIDSCPKLNFKENLNFVMKYGHYKSITANYKYSKGQDCLCSHYILAVDYSSSMEKLWPAVQFTVDQWIGTLKNLRFNFVSYFQFNTITNFPVYLHARPGKILENLLLEPEGRNGFGFALLRAIQIIQDFQHQNTCVILISDGLGNLPPTNLYKLLAQFSKIQNQGCWTCSVCFFFKPSDYDNGSRENQARKEQEKVLRSVCEELNAPIYETNERNFRKEFPTNIKQEVRSNSQRPSQVLEQ